MHRQTNISGFIEESPWEAIPAGGGILLYLYRNEICRNFVHNFP